MKSLCDVRNERRVLHDTQYSEPELFRTATVVGSAVRSTIVRGRLQQVRRETGAGDVGALEDVQETQRRHVRHQRLLRISTWVIRRGSQSDTHMADTVK